MPRPELVADCRRCAALCCVFSSFDASADFAFSKPAGVACRHLRVDGRCGVHAELVPRGLGGCAAYDCHGAGPRATRLFAARLLTRRQRHEVFLVLREIHELLWLLTGAADLCAPIRPALEAAAAALEDLAAAPARTLIAADLQPHRDITHRLLADVRAVVSCAP